MFYDVWIVCLTLVVVLLVTLVWEAIGLEGELAIVPSRILRTIRIFLSDWAYWIGNCIYRIFDFIWHRMVERLCKAALNLWVEFWSFANVPWEFVRGCFNGMIEKLPEFFTFLPFFLNFSIFLVMAFMITTIVQVVQVAKTDNGIFRK